MRRASSGGTHRRTWIIGSGVLALVAAIVVVGVVLGRPEVKKLLAPASCTVVAPSGTYTISAPQAANAGTIAAVGERDGMPDHAVSVALATAMQESKLINIDYGDRDSLGLFQQRPSEGWGTSAQVLDPVYASNAFYQALAKVPDWQGVAVTVAAQDVQHSADPGAYQQWASEAASLAEAFTGEAPAALSCTYQPPSATHDAVVVASSSPAGVPSGASSTTTSAIDAALTTQLGGDMPDRTVTSTKAGWELASWLVAEGQTYGLNAVTFDGWLWTPKAGDWSYGAVPAVKEVTYTTQAVTAR